MGNFGKNGGFVSVLLTHLFVCLFDWCLMALSAQQGYIMPQESRVYSDSCHEMIMMNCFV